jgi:hypothetical protein
MENQMLNKRSPRLRSGQALRLRPQTARPCAQDDMGIGISEERKNKSNYPTLATEARMGHPAAGTLETLGT